MLNAQHPKIPHIKRSIYSIEATSKSSLQLFIAVFLLCKKKQKWWSHTKKLNMLFMDPVWDSFPFYMRTVQSRTVTKITRVGSATDTRSDRSEFVFRPVPCKRMKRNVYMESDTNSYRSEFVPVSCIYPTLFSGTVHDPFAYGWHMKGAVSRQSNFASYPPSIAMELKVSKEIWDPSIHHFHIDHNAPCLPP